MKRPNIKCPYCGSQAFLRPSSVLNKHGPIYDGEKYYVCAHYPICDSYVKAHAFNQMPMGTLANSSLRRKRRDTHIALQKLWEHGLMTRKEAYRWLQTQMGLTAEDTHIAKFSEQRCEQVIQLCHRFPQLRNIAAYTSQALVFLDRYDISMSCIHFQESQISKVICRKQLPFILCI